MCICDYHKIYTLDEGGHAFWRKRTYVLALNEFCTRTIPQTRISGGSNLLVAATTSGTPGI
jgi:hypothetical protein